MPGTLQQKLTLPVVALFVVCAAAAGALAQAGSLPEAEREAVVQAAMDYMEGALSSDAERVGRGVHVELTRVTVATNTDDGAQYLRKSGYTQLIELVRAGRNQIPTERRNIEVRVFDIGHDLAVAVVTSVAYYDYLQLAKIEDEWKIVNVLWAPNMVSRDPSLEYRGTLEDEAAIERCALDYIDGSFSGSAERMERALHPELTKVVLYRLPQTGRCFLGPMGTADLVVGTEAGLGTLPPEARDIGVTIYDVAYDMATVKVYSSQYIDYLQCARIDGEWKIVNVLWVPNPAARGGSGF